MSMRSIRYDLEFSDFPAKLGLQPAPVWKRRVTALDPRSVKRERRSEKLDDEALRELERLSKKPDDGES